ncbi:serine proteinase stubble isoform X2 [Eurytemora carolleeae]|uniref:serine proteinase stubble isoform X2 n=1 Tax=Eurytemora carolleeae TaxID=1294199 RepID=UPI000C774E92|nr:serine proteinase stubble isoform X2 [Eurytemora carolleeae]|eukprot:XP_023337896.1 serine proteinase stubble-like isoform X2 [Eurytemora affinis]
MLKNIPPVVVQGLISLLCVSSSDPNPSIFLLTDPSSSNQKLTYSVPGVSSNRRRRDGFGFLQHSVSEDDFRHGPSPSTWSNNERFFFTRPQQKRGRPSRPREKFFVGDPSQCTTGSCEFFLFCWLSGGVVEGGCGGFLMSCCNRPNQFGHKVIVEQDNFAHPEVNWGEVRNDPRCGISAVRHSVAQRRIVGGDEAGFGTFPWQAYIRIGTSRCGGSLVNEWYVVTAGHCVARARPSQVRVTLGEYVLKSDAEPLPGRTYGASAIKVHPYFKFTPQADRFDVAVIRLNRRVDYAPHISPICLPPKNMPLLGHYGWASGWGALEPGSRLRPKTLQVVDVPMIDNRECEQWHREKGINVIIYDEMVCAGYYQGGKDSCQGDSGGPLMMEHEGRWTLIGLVSAGYSCAKRGQPGIYHRVAQTSDWISHSINS